MSPQSSRSPSAPRTPTALASVVAAIGILFLGACSSDRPAPVSVEDLNREQQPDQESWDVEYYFGEDGSPRAMLTAAHMARYESPDSVLVVLSGTSAGPVAIEVFGANEDRTEVLAREIRFLEESRVYELAGGVELVTSTGRTLKTERLTWDEPAGRLRAEGFVRIQSESEDLRGYGLDADEMLYSFTLHRVTGRYYIEDE